MSKAGDLRKANTFLEAKEILAGWMESVEEELRIQRKRIHDSEYHVTAYYPREYPPLTHGRDPLDIH